MIKKSIKCASLLIIFVDIRSMDLTNYNLTNLPPSLTPKNPITSPQRSIDNFIPVNPDNLDALTPGKISTEERSWWQVLYEESKRSITRTASELWDQQKVSRQKLGLENNTQTGLTEWKKTLKLYEDYFKHLKGEIAPFDRCKQAQFDRRIKAIELVSRTIVQMWNNRTTEEITLRTLASQLEEDIMNLVSLNSHFITPAHFTELQIVRTKALQALGKSLEENTKLFEEIEERRRQGI